MSFYESIDPYNEHHDGDTPPTDEELLEALEAQDQAIAPFDEIRATLNDPDAPRDAMFKWSEDYPDHDFALRLAIKTRKAKDPIEVEAITKKFLRSEVRTAKAMVRYAQLRSSSMILAGTAAGVGGMVEAGVELSDGQPIGALCFAALGAVIMKRLVPEGMREYKADVTDMRNQLSATQARNDQVIQSLNPLSDQG